MCKKIVVFILIFVLSHISFGQGFFKEKGINVDIYTGQVNVLDVESGRQYGLRFGLWPHPYFNVGLEGVLGNNMENKESWDFNRFHTFAGFHLRFFRYVYPYLIGSLGINTEPEDTDIKNPAVLTRFGASIKAGLALEIKKVKIAAEYGGGTMGTGHEEINFLFSYALRKLPKPNYLSDYNVKGGLHRYISYIGPYEGEDITGFDFIFEKKKNNKIREYNVGMIFTDYKYSTGCFNFGTGWQLNGKKIFDYVKITPGFQVLIWAEGDPDLILPAASLGLGLQYQIWKCIPFINSRTLLTYSFSNKLVLGSTYTFGIGFQF